ncbi:MAG: MarR family transcriptional regulator [Boseongicola sp.]|nr:MAG: MarR family transcriptional regulator [Boseongicola sp.]
MPDSDQDFEDLTDRPGHLIRRLHQIHVAMFLEECAAFNLTPVQFGVLTVLYDGKARDQVTIATMIGVDRNTAADVIRRLDRRDLLERPGDPADRRTKLAKITASGKELVDSVKPGMMRAQTRLVSPLSDAEYQQFMQLTLKLLEANDHSSRAPWKPFQDKVGNSDELRKIS